MKAKKILYFYPVEYYSTVQQTNYKFVGKWMEIEKFTLSDSSKTEKDKFLYI